MHNRSAIAALFMLIAFGTTSCSTFSRKHRNVDDAPALPPPIPAEISVRPVSEGTVVAPAQQDTTASMIPKVLQAKVSVRKVRPWIDDNGVLHENETITVIEEPARINPAALVNPHRSYIPAENQPILPGVAQWSPTGVVSQGVRQTGTPQNASLWEVYGVENVQILDLPEYDQGATADRIVLEQLGDGWMKLWDEKLGWVAVPKQQLRPLNR